MLDSRVSGATGDQSKQYFSVWTEKNSPVKSRNGGFVFSNIHMLLFIPVQDSFFPGFNGASHFRFMILQPLVAGKYRAGEEEKAQTSPGFNNTDHAHITSKGSMQR